LEEMLKHVQELKLAHPKLRAEASKELRLIMMELSKPSFQLKTFEKKYFLTENGVITELGKVGREVDMMFVLSLLEQMKAHLNRILESLEYEVC